MNSMRFVLLLLGLVLVGGCAAENDGEVLKVRAGWYRGNLHTHSLWSDGDEFPERIVTWYRDHGYQFLAISDHNTDHQGEKWVKYGDVYRKGSGRAADSYLRDFAASAQVRGDRSAGTQEIRLTPFPAYRALLERPGQFLLIPSEEISDHFGKKPIHMIATNIAEVIPPQGGRSVVEVITNNLRAVKEQGMLLGRPVLPHLAHPNFEWGVTAEEMAEVVEEHFFEIFNGHPLVHQQGDKDHPPVEKMWDIANTLRIVAFHAPPLMGLATDDSHHYQVPGMTRAMPGRGWVCVHARELSPGSLIAAMEAGDFYASTGVELSAVTYDETAKTLTVEIEPDANAKSTTRFVGTLADAAPGDVGTTLASVDGRRAVYQLTGRELYVRAVVTSDQDTRRPVWKGQKQQAWT
ncbi:MAG: PHP domain-containing protein, partial [Tepidisphaerales bacterium]